MNHFFGLAVLSVAIAVVGSDAHADFIVYQAVLNGPSESPPNASPGTGFAEVSFDLAAHSMHIQVTFADLLAPTTAAHIHSATAVPGVGTAGVATQVPSFVGFPLGVTSGTFDQTFNTSLVSFYNPTFVTNNGGTVTLAEQALALGLAQGRAYLNIHTSSFPAGEIRGFLRAVPEPASLIMLGLGSLSLLGSSRIRRMRTG